MPKRYRKKPVVIEAGLLKPTGESQQKIIKWIRDNGHDASAAPGKGVSIYTLEGVMLAEFGDYVIKGVQGEFYPCKPDIFAATYEAVEDE